MEYSLENLNTEFLFNNPTTSALVITVGVWLIVQIVKNTRSFFNPHLRNPE